MIYSFVMILNLNFFLRKCWNIVYLTNSPADRLTLLLAIEQAECRDTSFFFFIVAGTAVSGSTASVSMEHVWLSDKIELSNIKYPHSSHLANKVATMETLWIAT